MRTRALAPILLLSAAACGSGGGSPGTDPAARQEPIVITTDRGKYRAGEAIGLRISNRGSATYGYNPCVRTLERREGGGWSPVDEGDRICTMELRLLQPSETATATTETPGDLPPGEYRLVLGFSREDADPPAVPAGQLRVASGPFRITP